MLKVSRYVPHNPLFLCLLSVLLAGMVVSCFPFYWAFNKSMLRDQGESVFWIYHATFWCSLLNMFYFGVRKLFRRNGGVLFGVSLGLVAGYIAGFFGYLLIVFYADPELVNFQNMLRDPVAHWLDNLSFIFVVIPLVTCGWLIGGVAGLFWVRLNKQQWGQV